MSEIEIARIVEIYAKDITAEQTIFGEWEVWSRYPAHPEFDVKLATLHYSYVEQDNCAIRRAARNLVAMYGGDPESVTL